eukprot:COSAG01_NODE_62163_length_286_cov_0.556150_1_plen_57_part_01
MYRVCMPTAPFSPLRHQEVFDELGGVGEGLKQGGWYVALATAEGVGKEGGGKQQQRR